MSTGQGYKTKAAFKIETGVYGTAIALNGGGEYNQIHLVSENITPNITFQNSVSLEGNAGAKTLYMTGKKYAGELVLESYYNGLVPLLICAFGMSHQTLSPYNAGSGAYQHFIEPSDDMSMRAFRDGYDMTGATGNAVRRGTLAFEKDVSIWEFASAMVNSVSMEANPESVRFTLNMAARILTMDSATNSLSTNWATPTTGGIVLWPDITIYIKARDIFTITSSNDVIIIREPDEDDQDRNVDVPDGTYTGWELAQLIATIANADGILVGNYTAEYDEHQRKFKIKSSVNFIVDGAGDMNETVGFTTTDTSSNDEQQSPWDAIPDSYAVFDSDDQVGVSTMVWSLENNLDVESQDSESDLYIIEPERNGFRNVTGSIEIPRYQNDTFLKAVNGFTTYMMKIKFTGALIGGSNYEELNIYFPSIKFTNVGAPAAGAELIKQALTFQAQIPLDFYDPLNFFDYRFMIKSLSTDTFDLGSGDARTIGSYAGKIYCGNSAGDLEVWDGTGWSMSSDAGSGIYALKEYNGKLYWGSANGLIYEFNGVTFSISTDIGSNSIKAFEVYNNKLYALVDETGQVFELDVDTWSESTDTTSTDSFRLQAYNGNLYMLGDDGNGKVWAFNGTSWSESTDFTAGTITYGAMCVHRGKLYATSVDGTTPTLYSFDGTTWVVEGTLAFEPIEILSYRGLLLVFAFYGSSRPIYYWDFKTSAAVAITSANINIRGKSFLYGDAVVSTFSDDVKFMEGMKEIAIKIQNQNSTNPL